MDTMALIQALFAVFFRFMGRVLNTAFGWATVLLFGKVPESRQLYLSINGLGSVAWIVAVLGIVSPSFASLLLTFTTLPPWVNPGWIRLAMFATAALTPAVVGVSCLLMLDPRDRPSGLAGRAKVILRGYPYTLGLACTIVLMLVFAPYMKLKQTLRRQRATHIPIIVEPDAYLEVLRDIETALAAGGIETRRGRASWMLRFPTRVLRFFAGRSVDTLVANDLTLLESNRVEVTLHPSDLIIMGEPLDVSRAHAILTERLTLTKAYMTWSKEANEIEDRLQALWHALGSTRESVKVSVERLKSIERELGTLQVSYEEWEVLFREKLQIERCIWRAAAGMFPANDPCLTAIEGLRRAA
jgi:hypothetical protein